MALTKEELIGSLENEVRILLHLTGRVDAGMLDYRPSEGQRSTIELLRYLSYMGPAMTPGILAGQFDVAGWEAAKKAADAAGFEETRSAIERQREIYPALLGGVSEDGLAVPIEMFGRTQSKGAILVNLVLCGHAAYRTQLFLYLKANGHPELNTYNLWAGIDGA